MMRPEGITISNNESKSCAEIFRLYDRKLLNLAPYFQRNFIWTNQRKSWFINSLLIGLPVPQVYVTNNGSNIMAVIEGVQRLSTVTQFLSDTSWRLSNDTGLIDEIRGKKVEDIDQSVIEALELVNIPFTVVNCDMRKVEHRMFIVELFRALNTGGCNLSAQEVRNCIYAGNFNNMLKEIVQYKNFRKLLDLEDGKSYRYRYEELVLKVFALTDEIDNYKGNMKRFTDMYMDSMKDKEPRYIKSYRDVFIEVIDTLYIKMRNEEPLPRYNNRKLNKLFIEALFVGLINNIENVRKMDSNELMKRFEALTQHRHTRDLFVTQATSAVNKLKARIAAAENTYK